MRAVSRIRDERSVLVMSDLAFLGGSLVFFAICAALVGLLERI
jgi:hypothetical protein